MRVLLAALLLLVAAIASADTTTIGRTTLIGPNRTIATNNGQIDARDVWLCFVPDVQHMSAGKQWAPDFRGLTCQMTNPVNSISPAICADVQSQRCCGGDNCNDSIYCQGSWRDTTARLLYNMAYEMTGDLEEIDYTGITGQDVGPRTRPISRQGFPRCDAIISLGDMADQPTFTNVETDPEFGYPVVYPDDDQFTALNTANAHCDALSEQTRHEWEVVENFWRIIDVSGIPYLPVAGNHDTPSCYRRLMNRLNFTSKPFYYARETTGEQSWAIKFNTNSGKQFCIIGIDDGFVNALGTVDGLLAADKTFVLANIGCGGGLPTILVQHGATGGGAPTGPSATWLATTVLGDAANNEVFALVGGHYGTPSSIRSFHTALTVDFWSIYANWQDKGRHQEGPANFPSGTTTMDSLGGMLTIMRIRPAVDRVFMYDWNSYYQTSSVPAHLNVQSITFSQTDASWDFDARFP